MKKVILVFLNLMALAGLRGQQKIKYIFPDAIEIAVDSCFNRMEDLTHTKSFYLFLKCDSTIYGLTIGWYDSSERKNVPVWVEQSNRYAIINARFVPLIFDYDFEFSTPRSNEIGVFKKRNGEIIRSRLLLHSITIYFNRQGKITREVNY